MSTYNNIVIHDLGKKCQFERWNFASNDVRKMWEEMYNDKEFIYMMHYLHSKWLQIFEAPINIAIIMLLLLNSKRHWFEIIGWQVFCAISNHYFLHLKILFKKPKYWQLSCYLEKKWMEIKKQTNKLWFDLTSFVGATKCLNIIKLSATI